MGVKPFPLPVIIAVHLVFAPVILVAGVLALMVSAILRAFLVLRYRLPVEPRAEVIDFAAFDPIAPPVKTFLQPEVAEWLNENEIRYECDWDERRLRFIDKAEAVKYLLRWG